MSDDITFSYWSKPAEDGFLYVVSCEGRRAGDGVKLTTYQILAARELADAFFALSLELTCGAMRARLRRAFGVTPIVERAA